MKLIDDIMQRTKKMEWCYYSLLKMGIIFMGFFLITAFTQVQTIVLNTAWYWHLVIALVLLFPVMRKVYFD